MRVVVAPDSFKGSMTATDAARTIAQGWRSVRPDDELVELPQADGGEGTLDAFASAFPDARRRIARAVTGPDGGAVDAEWLLLADGTAVVELARSSGLPLLDRPDPLGATTRGLGEVIAAALDAGAESLVIGLGGSASTDGGAAAVEVLRGRPAPAGGVRLLTDVTAPLLGPEGAAAAFGPQKGASPTEVARLEERLRVWAARHPHVDPATPGAGAAGGTAFGLLALWPARIAPGAATIAELTGLTCAIASADVLVTGEGRFDETSLRGKVVGHALRLAEVAALRGVVVIAGAIASPLPTVTGGSTASISLTRLAGSTDAALRDPGRWVRRAGEEAARAVEAVRHR